MQSWLGIKERPEGFRLTEDQTHPLRKGLVFAGLGGGYCNRSLRYHDSSVFGNHGTLANMEPATDWVWSNELWRFALSTDSSDGPIEHVVVPHSTSLNIASAITLSMWVNAVDYGSHPNGLGRLFQKGPTAGAFMLLLNKDYPGLGTNNFVFYDGGEFVSASNGCVSLATWQNLAVANTGSSVSFYVNGVLINTASGTFTLSTTTESLILFSNSLGLYFKGKSSDPLIHNRALTASEIQKIADPSNVMLSGLLLPPRRKWWPVVVSSPVLSHRNLVLGGGVL